MNCDILRQIATLSKGNGLSKDDLSQDGNKCILYGELYTRYLGYIDTIISKTKTILSKPKLSKSGDIIMPLSGETPTDISNSAVVPEDNVILGGDLLVITPKKNIDPLFLSLYLSNCKKKEIAKKSCGISIIHSHKEDIAKLTINYPSLAEQYYISTFLKKLTKKTDIVLKKINILKKYKKGLLFQYKKEANKNGKTLKFASICSLISGYNFNTNDYVTNGKFDIVTIGNVMDDRYIEGDYKHVNFIPNSYVKLSKGDLLISMTGNVGRCSYVNDNNKLLNQRLCKFECEDTNKKFIYMITKTNSFKKRMNILAQGGAQPNLKNNDILNYVFFKIENNITHQKYFEAFDKIDLLLEQSKRLTKNLKHLKKNLLNQLFI